MLFKNMSVKTAGRIVMTTTEFIKALLVASDITAPEHKPAIINEVKYMEGHIPKKYKFKQSQIDQTPKTPKVDPKKNLNQ